MDDLWTTAAELGWVTWLTALGVALGGSGLRIRGQARRRGRWLAHLAAARRSILDIVPGAVTVMGRWRRLEGGGGTRGLVEDVAVPSQAVVIERDTDPGFADGQPVVVSGFATHREPSPVAAAGYRDDGQLWIVDARGRGQLCAGGTDAIEHAARVAQRWSRVGAALFAAGMALCLTTLLVSWRISDG